MLKSVATVAGLVVASSLSAFALGGGGTPAAGGSGTTPAAVADATAAFVAAASTRTPACDRQTWPFVASECLAAADGSAARRVVRTVGAR